MICMSKNIIYYEEMEEKIAFCSPESKEFLVHELKHILCKWEQVEIIG
jgi:hypothetical protein